MWWTCAQCNENFSSRFRKPVPREFTLYRSCLNVLLPIKSEMSSKSPALVEDGCYLLIPLKQGLVFTIHWREKKYSRQERYHLIQGYFSKTVEFQDDASESLKLLEPSICRIRRSLTRYRSGQYLDCFYLLRSQIWRAEHVRAKGH